MFLLLLACRSRYAQFLSNHKQTRKASQSPEENMAFSPMASHLPSFWPPQVLQEFQEVPWSPRLRSGSQLLLCFG